MVEQQLIQKIKAGDTAAFTILVETYQKRVYSVAYGIMRNQADAMDISQETFMKAWDRIGSWRGEASLSTWLCRIASNAALDYLRKNKRVIPVEQVEYSNQQPGVDIDVIESEQRAELNQAVSGLPKDYRELLVLRHAGDMSYQDMADTLGLSLSQVKNRLLRARQMLKNSLAGRID